MGRTPRFKFHQKNLFCLSVVQAKCIMHPAELVISLRQGSSRESSALLHKQASTLSTIVDARVASVNRQKTKIVFTVEIHVDSMTQIWSRSPLVFGLPAAKLSEPIHSTTPKECIAVEQTPSGRRPSSPLMRVLHSHTPRPSPVTTPFSA